MNSWIETYEHARFPTTRFEINAFAEIREYPIGRLEEACKIVNGLDEDLSRVHERFIHIIGQQRDICLLIGVKDYVSLSGEDMLRVKTAALYRVYLEEQSVQSSPQ
ncbi:TPA: hypothetical protein HA241_00650 [Candidatus Woesearchaeota archaeon]|nr:hypothetical protein [Candidatus Woesearchaeota archaeon]